MRLCPRAWVPVRVGNLQLLRVARLGRKEENDKKKQAGDPDQRASTRASGAADVSRAGKGREAASDAPLPGALRGASSVHSGGGLGGTGTSTGLTGRTSRDL